MRRLLLVSVTVFLAAGLALSASLSVDAQTSQQYDSGGGEVGLGGGNDPSGGSPAPKASGATASAPEGSSGAISALEATLSDPASDAASSAPNFGPTDPNPYHQVVDNATRGRFKAAGWGTKPSAGAYGKDYAIAGSSKRTTDARFRVAVPETRYYSVYARWPAGEQNATATRFGVPSVSGMRWDTVDQRTDAGFWVRVGTYKMQKGGQELRVQAGSGQGRAVADAVMIVDDVLVGPDGGTASYADPEALAGVTAVGSGETARSATMQERAGGRVTGRDIVRAALRHRGTPYGNNTCRSMVQEDCSCHTLLVYRRFGLRLPDSPVYQWRLNYNKSRQRSWLRPGDLAFQDLTRDGRMSSHYGDHVGIYVGNNSIVHASSYFDRVVVTDLKYLPNYWGGMRPRPLR